MSSNVNYVAFGTITTLGVVTIASAIGAALITSTVTVVALAALAVLGASVSIAATAAYFDESSIDVESYFKNVKSNCGYAIAGMVQLVAQVLVQAVIEGIAQGVGTLIRRKISGPDHTFAHG